MRKFSEFFITALLSASLAPSQQAGPSRKPDVPYVPTTEAAVKATRNGYYYYFGSIRLLRWIVPEHKFDGLLAMAERTHRTCTDALFDP